MQPTSFTLIVFVLICLLTISACTESSETNAVDDALIAMLDESTNGAGLSHYILPNSDDYNAIPQDPQNPITAEKVTLGRLLFHETGIAVSSKNASGTGTYSCASCHHAQGGFQACKPQGIGDGGMGFGLTGEGRIPNLSVYDEADLDVQPLRTPSALNIAYQTNVLWNGQFGGTGVNIGTESQWTEDTPIATNHLGYEGTEIQAIAGLGVHRLVVHDSIFVGDKAAYIDLFAAAFPELAANERINAETAGLAIAAYERTLLANQSPFQQWLKGNTEAMTRSQKLGALLFFGKGNCDNCHNGPALNAMEFYALGMNDLSEGHNIDPDAAAHKGRGGFTNNAADMYKFKVPQLYNLKDSPFYGHGASFRSVEEVIKYKNEAIAENANVPASQLADAFKSLYLSEAEVSHITNFIENALHDPELTRYIPESVPSGNCFPNNDLISKEDLGC